MQHNVGLPTQYRFNFGPASQTIAGSMQVDRIRRWPNIETELGDCSVFSLTAIRVTLYPLRGHYPDNTIHWPNCEIMLGHSLRRLATLFQPKPFKLLTTNIILNFFFLSEDFLNTKVLNLGTSNVILDMLIRTYVQKCQPFPTHSTPFSTK